MNIEQLKKKSELHQLCLDEEEIINNYGEPITFWIRDHIDINTYFDFYRYQSEKNGDELFNTIKRLVLTADGQPAIVDDEILPIDVTLNLLIKVNEFLGKLKTKPSTLKTGQPQE